jgi:putative ABC transport system permease protein
VGDVKYAIRLLLRSPGFTAVTVLSLALSIGASTALFSVVDAVLLRMLPVTQPDRLVSVSLGGWGDSSSYRAFETLRDGSQDVLDGLAAYARRPLTMSGASAPERVEGAFVSGTFFSTLGVAPSVGRALTPQDDRDAAGGGVVVSHAFWRSRLGSDPTVLGRGLRINGHPFQVVGVTPAGFFGVEIGRAIDIYLPLTAAADIGALDRGMMTGDFSTWLRLVGRLAPGVDQRHAAARLTVLLRDVMRAAVDELERSSGASPERRQRLLAWQATLQPVGRGYGTVLRSRLATPLTAASVLVGLMLLLVSANIASLLMGRTVARSREVAIRLSLGAGRGRIARQILTESALLGMAGTCAGVLLAPFLGNTAVRYLPADLGPISLDLSVDWRLVCVGFVLFALTTVLVSLAPAIRATGRNRPNLKVATVGVTERVRVGPQKALVGLQVAVCVVVLVLGALFVQTLRNLGRVDLGLAPEQVLMASIDPSSVGYREERLQALYRVIQDRLTAIPDITSGSLIVGQPFLLRRGSDVEIEGRRINLRWEVVAPRFFDTMGMSLKAGRDFTHRDNASAPRVAIVNETLARQQFPGQNPVGNYIHTFGMKDGQTIRTPTEIVGIVRDVIHRSPRDEPRPVLYAPAAQESFALSPATIVVRSRLSPMHIVDTVTQTVSQTAPDLALFDIKTFEQQIEEAIWAERLLARVAGGFGITTLVLAGLGLFGTLSQTVARRTREIGIRMALGADMRTIRRGVVGESLLLCTLGALCGAPFAVAGSRYLTQLLFGVAPGDWRALLIAAAMLGMTAALAAYLPARRASRVDPMQVLRAE